MVKGLAVVTGAAGGIGRAVCMRFQRAGLMVVGVDMDSANLVSLRDEIARGGGECETIVADLSTESGVAETVRRVLEFELPLKVLVNGAGVAPTTHYSTLSGDEWDRVMSINLKSAFFMCAGLAQRMAKDGGGAMVQIASIAGKTGGLVPGVHYAVSKAGMICMTKRLSRELAPLAIRVNAVAPGIIDTPMTTEFPNDVSVVALRRMGTADEVAEVVEFLSLSARYVTGVTIDVTGGMASG